MNTCTILFRKYWKWVLLLLICFLFQVLLTLLFNQIEKTNKFNQNSIHLNVQKVDHLDQVQLNHQLVDQLNQIGEAKQLNRKSQESQTSEIKDSNNEFMCNSNDLFLKSAIERAKTNDCRLQIKDVFCRHQAGQLYLETIDHCDKCPNNSLFKHIGCYLNNRRPTTIDSLAFRYRKANELRCSYLCIQLDTKYFGIENATVCHCFRELPSEQLIIKSSLCNTYCDKTKVYRCGGPYLISVYQTNVIDQNDQEQKSSQQDVKKDSPIGPIRIAFLFSVNGRSIRQIKRLIKRLYDPRHIYFVHVDRQNDFLFDSLSNELGKLSNLIVTGERFYTIWGGSQLLEMLLNSFKLLLSHEWQYVINLSESDYLIKSLTSLEHYLQRFRGNNFLKFHGQNNDDFVRKQGLQVLFLQCENKMWRLNKERNLLKKISFTGGSDWFAIDRSFVNFIINASNGSTNEFLNNLKKFFNHTLLPAESFFHTLLQNSKFCTQFINNNLRITNWKRKIGCRCQYRHVVDWCGCSPNVFREQDLIKLKSTLNKPLFFARKFDPLIDHEIINQVEFTYDSSPPVNVHKYWHNVYHFKYDRSPAPVTYTLLSSIAFNELFSDCSNYYELMNIRSISDTVTLTEVNTFINQGKHVGTQISFNLTRFHQFKFTHLKLEILVSPLHHFKQYDRIDSRLELVSLKVCTDYDVKEDFFKNFGCLINSESQLIVRHRWKYLGHDRLPQNYTIYFVWVHETGKKIASEIHSSNLSITKKTNQINGYFEVQHTRPIHPGVWRLLLVSNSSRRANGALESSNSRTSFPSSETEKSIYVNCSENLSSSKSKLIELLNDIPISDERRQCHLIAETQFLVLDSHFRSNSPNSGPKYAKAVQELKSFWKIKDICSEDLELDILKLVDPLHSVCMLTIKSCLNTTWSSTLPDPKSQFDFN